MSLPRSTLLALAGAVLLVALLSTTVAGALTTEEESTDRTVLAQSSTNVSVENVTVWIAPQSASSNLTNESAIDAAKASGTLTRHPRVAVTDTLVLEVNVTGLDERIATVDGDNETDRFLRAVYEGEDHATLVQTNPDTHVQALAAQFDHDSTTVVTASAADTYYLVVEPDDLSVGYCEAACPAYGDESPVVGNVSNDRISHDTALAMNLTIDDHTSTPRRDDDGGLAPILELDEVETDVVDYGYDAGVAPVPAKPAASVPIQTNLAPGTAATVRIANRSDDGPPLLYSTSVVAQAGTNVEDPDDFDPDHGVVAEFDTSAIAPNATFDVDFLANGRVVESVPGVVRDESTPTAVPATVTADTPTAEGDGDPTSTTTTGDVRTSPAGPDGNETTPHATGRSGPGFGPTTGLLTLVTTVATLRYRAV